MALFRFLSGVKRDGCDTERAIFLRGKREELRVFASRRAAIMAGDVGATNGYVLDIERKTDLSLPIMGPERYFWYAFVLCSCIFL